MSLDERGEITAVNLLHVLQVRFAVVGHHLRALLMDIQPTIWETHKTQIHFSWPNNPILVFISSFLSKQWLNQSVNPLCSVTLKSLNKYVVCRRQWFWHRYYRSWGGCALVKVESPACWAFILLNQWPLLTSYQRWQRFWLADGDFNSVTLAMTEHARNTNGAL